MTKYTAKLAAALIAKLNSAPIIAPLKNTVCYYLYVVKIHQKVKNN
jgi:hypothetical protein